MRGARVAAAGMALGVVLAVGAAGAHGAPDAASPASPTLAQIMADPDWIGPPVRGAYWAADGSAVYYTVKRSAAPVEDLHRVDLASGRDQVIDAKMMADADGPPVYDRAERIAAFVRNGDVFVRRLPRGAVRQITRTPEVEANPRLSADGKWLTWRVGNDWYVHDLGVGVTMPAAVLKLEKDPSEAPKADDLRDMQLRTFSTLKKLHDDKEFLRRYSDRQQDEDGTRSPRPFYLGDEVTILDTSLSPDARWLAVVTEPKKAELGAEGKFTRYVTESGYEEFDKERLRVGRNPPPPQSLLLLDLHDHTIHPLAVDALPGIDDDPLKAVREENGLPAPAGEAGARKPRGVMVKPKGPEAGPGRFAWSADGRNLALQLRAIDNKDRWLATVDFERFGLVTQHRLTDAAWIGSRFDEFGWMPDGRTLWYESEESGFGHLYTKAPGAAAQALTHGRFEVYDPKPSADGRWIYVLSNAEAPYAYDVYRVRSTGGDLERITHLQGAENFALGRGDTQLLVTHSASYTPAQIALIRADGAGSTRELTDTRTAGYRSLSWIEPEIVEVPSTHVSEAIYAKLYQLAPAPAGAAPRPGVIFVHGAGYTQDVHRRFPYYFREQMFHNLLVRQGYVVIDLDYRASSGYGRDWRTAIYRQMGHPELEDLLDGKRWLVEHAGVDPKRVGIYGGSYGGFMTLMALFRAPGEFAAGAALRPVTDWMQYEHGYTSDILNDPQIDPIAYRRSSPLEFAAGLSVPLLICHGIVDDNVLFEDSIRLYQRLIELHKDDFTISPYALDPHGFVNADSWLDEYKRIARLFDDNLRNGGAVQTGLSGR